MPGPFDWDMRRLAASFVIAGGERGLGTRAQRAIVRRLCATFRQCMAESSRMDTLDVWYYQFGAENILAIADTVLERKRRKPSSAKPGSNRPGWR